MKRDILNGLPIGEERETVWYREIWFQGKLLERKHVIKLFFEFLSSTLNEWKMILKCNAASYLLKGVADACPYCSKLINRDDFTKLIEEEPFNQAKLKGG